MILITSFNFPLLMVVCANSQFEYNGARALQESSLATEGLILAFWLRCVLLPWQSGSLKQDLKMFFVYLKKSPVVRVKLTLNPFCQHCSNKVLT